MIVQRKKLQTHLEELRKAAKVETAAVPRRSCASLRPRRRRADAEPKKE